LPTAIDIGLVTHIATVIDAEFAIAITCNLLLLGYGCHFSFLLLIDDSHIHCTTMLKMRKYHEKEEKMLINGKKWQGAPACHPKTPSELA
jgi:hypothetical protein